MQCLCYFKKDGKRKRRKETERKKKKKGAEKTGAKVGEAGTYKTQITLYCFG